MPSYRLYQVDAFTTRPLTGNPAGVVPNADGLSDDTMQAIAREMNNSETAFILAPDGRDHDVRVRFFTPATEVPSCGHATIAAHYVRAVEQRLPTTRVVQKIGAGCLPVDILHDGTDYRIVMTQGTVEFGDVLSANRVKELTRALGINRGHLDDRGPTQIVSTGHAKVLIGIRSLDVLQSIRPDLARLEELSGKIGCNGYYVFALCGHDTDALTVGRMFAPAIGIAEDPVTGNANGPLGAYLVRYGLLALENGCVTFRARQGDSMRRPGTIDVEVEGVGRTPVRVRVGGRAVIVFRTEVCL